MNKMRQLTAAIFIVSSMNLQATEPLPMIEAPLSEPDLWAENRPADPEASPIEDALRFTLQHRFNGGDPLPIETIEIPFTKLEDNPLLLLQAIKDNFSKHLEKQPLPVEIDTELEWLLSAEDTEVLGKLPTLSIKTNIDSNGAGKSDLLFPAYQRKVPEEFGKGVIDWKGLTAQFTFTDQFENLTVALNFKGIDVKDEDAKFFASLGETTLNGKFDANLIPNKMAIDLASIEVIEYDNYLNLKDFAFNFELTKSPKGLELVDLNFKVGPVDFNDQELTSKLGGLVLTVDSDTKDGNVTSTLHVEINDWVIPEDILGEALQASFGVKELAFRNLDEEALLVLQTIVEQTSYDPDMSDLMLEKFMKVSPQLLKNSPEIVLNQLTLKTSKGNLEGSISVSVNGYKHTSFDILALIIGLQAEANLSVSKNLLEEVVTAQILEMMLEDFGMDINELGEEDLAILKEQSKAASKQLISEWSVDNGDGSYKLVALFRNGSLMVNGEIVYSLFN